MLESLSKNHQGLRKADSKFFMLTINPSQKEIKHLKALYGDEKEALKAYTKDIMRGYAMCMNRELDGRPLTEKYLVWYGMYEEERKYNAKSHEVIHNKEYLNLQKKVDNGKADRIDQERYREMQGLYVINKEGRVEKKMTVEAGDELIRRDVKKRGENAHIHVLVHRKDKSGKLSLSPLTNSKGGENIITRYYDKDGKRISKAKAETLSVKQGKSLSEAGIRVEKEKARIGFNRVYFKQYGESAFDYKFKYDRTVDQSFWHYNTRMKTPAPHFTHTVKASALQVKNIATSEAKKLHTKINPISYENTKSMVKNQLSMDKMNQYLTMHGLLPNLSFRSAINMGKEAVDVVNTTAMALTGVGTPAALAKMIVGKTAKIALKPFKVGANIGLQAIKTSVLKI